MRKFIAVLTLSLLSTGPVFAQGVFGVNGLSASNISRNWFEGSSEFFLDVAAVREASGNLELPPIYIDGDGYGRASPNFDPKIFVWAQVFCWDIADVNNTVLKVTGDAIFRVVGRAEGRKKDKGIIRSLTVNPQDNSGYKRKATGAGKHSGIEQLVFTVTRDTLSAVDEGTCYLGYGIRRPVSGNSREARARSPLFPGH